MIKMERTIISLRCRYPKASSSLFSSSSSQPAATASPSQASYSQTLTKAISKISSCPGVLVQAGHYSSPKTPLTLLSDYHGEQLWPHNLQQTIQSLAAIELHNKQDSLLLHVIPHEHSQYDPFSRRRHGFCYSTIS